MTTSTATSLGAALAERLNLSIAGREGPNTKCGCIFCGSSDGLRIHDDGQRWHCLVCDEGGGTLELAERVLGSRPQAIEALVEVQIFEPRSSTNGHAANGQATPGGTASPPDCPPGVPAADWAAICYVANARGLSPHALRAYGAMRLTDTSIKIPMWNGEGKVCSEFHLGATGKGLNAKGKPTGVFLPFNWETKKPILPQAGEVWHFVEGVKDACALFVLGFFAVGLPGSALAAKFAPLFKGVVAIIIPDNDRAGGDGSQKTARSLSSVAQTIKIATLPTLYRESKGDDCRDVLRREDGEALLRGAIESAEVWQPQAMQTGAPVRKDAKDIDAGLTAKLYLDSQLTDGVSHIVYWRGSWHRYIEGRFLEISASAMRADIVRWLMCHCVNLTVSATNNVLDCLRGLAAFPSWINQPSWRDHSGPAPGCWPAEEVLVAKNGLAHLPSFILGKDYLLKLTPQLFSANALSFDFDENAPVPENWLMFLHDLWPEDEEAIELLREWFGYCLLNDTTLQKILALIGPKRSGKGTIARVLRALIGHANVAGPTLAGLSGNFGLQPLLGKSLAIISDARLSGRTDSAVVTERLLSISGEDALTVDIKHGEAVTLKLPTRLMVLSNELPRLSDASGALASRMLLLRLDQSFYGREDRALSDRLIAELPGILMWAVAGWNSLNQRGHFVQPASGRELLEDLDDVVSPIGAFVKQRCVVGPDWRSSIDDLFAAWQNWCESAGRREAGTKQIFARDLVASVPSLRRTQPRENGERFRAYDGIGLIDGYR